MKGYTSQMTVVPIRSPERVLEAQRDKISQGHAALMGSLSTEDAETITRVDILCRAMDPKIRERMMELGMALIDESQRLLEEVDPSVAADPCSAGCIAVRCVVMACDREVLEDEVSNP